MNILDIKYCAQDLRFEETAYKKFDQYEQELKQYFLEQTDGYDIFEDLKLRICEMLQSKMKISGEAISEQDIVEIKNSIGHVEQLEGMVDEEADTVFAEEEPLGNEEKKKLYRNENEKMIAGVCSGLGNYFSIDPLAFRLLFVLAVVLSNGLGIISYAIFWIALKSKPLPTNLSKRLYRNGADKVIAGVCGGLASFFKTEAWIIRVIFLSPLILNITTQGFFDFGFSIFNGSALGFSIVAYIVLWITTKESATPTEELLARGEDINLNSINEETERVQANPDTNSNFNNILRIIAFILIGLSLLASFVFLIALIFGSVFMLPLTGSILHTPVLRLLGGLCIVFFFLLPFVGLVVWSIRRLRGVKGPNKNLRTSFGALWGLGFTASLILAFFLFSEFRVGAEMTERIDLPVQGDTLIVNQMLGSNNSFHKEVSYSSALVNDFYEEGENEQRSRLISFDKKESKDGTFYMEIEKNARGKGNKDALANAGLANVKHIFAGNELQLTKYVSLPLDAPYRFQYAKVTFYVPKGKVLDIDPKIKRFKIGNRNITINGDWEDIDQETKEEVEEAIDEVGEVIQGIGETMEEVGVSIEKAAEKIGKKENNISKQELDNERSTAIEKQERKVQKEQEQLEEMKRAEAESKLKKD